MARETWVQYQVESYQRLKKWYLVPPCLTLGIIRYGSRVKWINPGKGVASSPTHWCSSYRKGSLQVTLDNGRQLYLPWYRKKRTITRNYRPIMCPPRIWKIQTSQIKEDIYCSLISRALFPEVQRRCCGRTRGTSDPLYIEPHILKKTEGVSSWCNG